MRKIILEHDNVKNMISELLGEHVKLLVNRGRKRVVRYSGVLLAVYPAIFTVKIENNKSATVMTYSYSDVVCGDVKISKKAV